MTASHESSHAASTAARRHFLDRRVISRSTVPSFVRLAFVRPQELAIRSYLPSDREAVWDLHVTALEAVGARAIDPETRGVDADFADIDGVYLRNDGEFLVGLLSDRIVAIGALKRLTSFDVSSLPPQVAVTPSYGSILCPFKRRRNTSTSRTASVNMVACKSSATRRARQSCFVDPN